MIDLPHEPLELESTCLRPLLHKDFDEMVNLTKDASSWTYFTSDLSDPITLKAWIDTAISESEKSTRLPFAIIDKSQNCLIGCTSLGNFSPRDLRIEIGWTWISPTFRGQGHNDQSKHLLLKYAFEKLSIERVECKTDILNTAARKALQRIGFIEEGVLRSHTLMTHGRRRDTIFYSILKNEWLGAPETLKD